MTELSRRLVGGALIYVATAIRFYYQARTRSRPMVMIRHLPIARGAATISSQGWFLLLIFAPLGRLVPVDDLPISSTWRTPLAITGAVVLFVSIALFYWCHLALGEFWYGEPGLKSGHELVRAGPYRLIRHPMYTSFFVGYVGSLLLLQSWVFLLPFVFAPGFYVMTVVEERILIEQFGDSYRRYSKEAGRFLPKPWAFIRRG
jgi:protein-S-isoprenylcysteine O-methyltransferase Ste14